MSDLISRQAAIDAIINICEECDTADCGPCRANFPGTRDCIKVIGELPPAQPEAQLPEEGTTTDTTFGTWIPVSEKLPDTDDMMLVTAQPKKGKPNVNRAYYMNGYWHGSGSMAGVTAWMPLPEPYTEE